MEMRDQLSLFVDNVISYLENSKESMGKLKTIREFIKAADYNINIKNK